MLTLAASLGRGERRQDDNLVLGWDGSYSSRPHRLCGKFLEPFSRIGAERARPLWLPVLRAKRKRLAANHALNFKGPHYGGRALTSVRPVAE